MDCSLNTGRGRFGKIVNAVLGSFVLVLTYVLCVASLGWLLIPGMRPYVWPTAVVVSICLPAMTVGWTWLLGGVSSVGAQRLRGVRAQMALLLTAAALFAIGGFVEEGVARAAAITVLLVVDPGLVLGSMYLSALRRARGASAPWHVFLCLGLFVAAGLVAGTAFLLRESALRPLMFVGAGITGAGLVVKYVFGGSRCACARNQK